MVSWPSLGHRNNTMTFDNDVRLNIIVILLLFVSLTKIFTILRTIDGSRFFSLKTFPPEFRHVCVNFFLPVVDIGHRETNYVTKLKLSSSD